MVRINSERVQLRSKAYDDTDADAYAYIVTVRCVPSDEVRYDDEGVREKERRGGAGAIGERGGGFGEREARDRTNGEWSLQRSWVELQKK